MKNKLKELSKYCCKPANEQEYDFVKTCAKKGGVRIEDEDYYEDTRMGYRFIQNGNVPTADVCLYLGTQDGLELIPVTQFCDILLKDESEFKPKVGEWCVRNLDGNVSEVFMVDAIRRNNLIISKATANGNRYNNRCAYLSFGTFRQPTPEEIQTAIDAWDDRVTLFRCDEYVITPDGKSFYSQGTAKWRVSEDCKTVELIKS
jgi:hypothetical protein